MNTLNEQLLLPHRVVLASASPRRTALLDQVQLSHEVLPSSIDEEAIRLQYFDHYDEYVEHLAEAKAKQVFDQNQDALVIGADTVVVLDGKILEKPKHKDEAFEMLSRLSGRTHSVFTATALCAPQYEDLQTVETKVTFRSMSEAEIHKYIDSGSPMDKAGAYGIQDDYGALFVVGVEGCYYNVVGLSLSNLFLMLQSYAVGNAA